MKILGVVVLLSLLALLAGWLALRAPDIPFASLEAKYATPTSRFVDLPGGVHLHYQDDGDPGALPLVLLHGFGDSFLTWKGWTAALRDRFRVITVDLPGHGLTRAPADYRLTGDELAGTVDAFAQALALPPFAVAGNSMGGGVAWRMAVLRPPRIKALVLIDAVGFPPRKAPTSVPLAFRILQYSWGRKFLASIDNTPLIRQALKVDVFDPAVITPELVARWAELQRAPGHRQILMGVSLGAQRAASAESVSKIHAPTLVIHGDADPLIELASSRDFAKYIPGAKLLVYPKVGHLPQIEIPQRSAEDTAAFLKAALR